jgi:hypothetical protein
LSLLAGALAHGCQLQKFFAGAGGRALWQRKKKSILTAAQKLV